MRRPVRGFLGCLTCPVDHCGDLATLNNHAVEFADVDRIVKTHGQLVARAVANIAGPVAQAVRVYCPILRAACSSHGAQVVLPATQAIAHGLSCGPCWPAIAVMILPAPLAHSRRVNLSSFRSDADFSLGACIANRPQKC